MRLIDVLSSHPLLEERPVNHVFEPLGFEIHIESQEVPDNDEAPEDAERYEADPGGYMAAIPFDVPEGFIEFDRFDTEDSEIVMLAVKPTTPLAHLLMLPAEGAPSVSAIAAERVRQIEAEGWSPEHDDEHDKGELAAAASAYANWAAWQADGGMPVGKGFRPTSWPKGWHDDWWKPSTARRNLERAGALIVAELERLDRMEGKR